MISSQARSRHNGDLPPILSPSRLVPTRTAGAGRNQPLRLACRDGQYWAGGARRCARERGAPRIGPRAGRRAGRAQQTPHATTLKEDTAAREEGERREVEGELSLRSPKAPGLRPRASRGPRAPPGPGPAAPGFACRGRTLTWSSHVIEDRTPRCEFCSDRRSSCGPGQRHSCRRRRAVPCRVSSRKSRAAQRRAPAPSGFLANAASAELSVDRRMARMASPGSAGANVCTTLSASKACGSARPKAAAELGAGSRGRRAGGNTGKGVEVRREIAASAGEADGAAHVDARRPRGPPRFRVSPMTQSWWTSTGPTERLALRPRQSSRTESLRESLRTNLREA